MHCINGILDEYPDCMLVSNINIYGRNAIPYSGIKDFEKYNNGDQGIIFLIDEIHTLFSSLESQNMPVSTLTVWSQNRKNRRLILGTSQRFTRAAKGLREQTTWHYDCKREIIIPFLAGLCSHIGSMMGKNITMTESMKAKNRSFNSTSHKGSFQILQHKGGCETQ